MVLSIAINIPETVIKAAGVHIAEACPDDIGVMMMTRRQASAMRVKSSIILGQSLNYLLFDSAIAS